MKVKVKKIITAIFIVIGIVGVYFLGFFTREFTYTEVERAVLNILDKYQKYYYFANDDVVNDIAHAIFDDYSTYYTKEEYDEVKLNASGKNLGIGIGVTPSNLEIVEVIKNSPCYKKGVTSGGTLYKISVNGVDKPFTTYNEFDVIISNVNESSNILLTILYGDEERVFELKKAEYQKSYVTYIDSVGEYCYIENEGEISLEKCSDVKVLGEDIAYIKYDQFSGKEQGLKGSAGQLRNALEKFKNDNKKKLIFDLRNNGGGYMDVLGDVAGTLVQPEGDKQVISIAEYKNGKEQKFYLKNNTYLSYGFEKIIALANENTASASEVLIGAMLDYDKNDVVSVVIDGHISNGQRVFRTYGKGIMQTTYVNLDGSAVKLTTAKICWPKSKIDIHDSGITTNVSNKVINADRYDALVTALKMLEE